MENCLDSISSECMSVSLRILEVLLGWPFSSSCAYFRERASPLVLFTALAPRQTKSPSFLGKKEHFANIQGEKGRKKTQGTGKEYKPGKVSLVQILNNS